jgi:hypothetical protein
MYAPGLFRGFIASILSIGRAEAVGFDCYVGLSLRRVVDVRAWRALARFPSPLCLCLLVYLVGLDFVRDRKVLQNLQDGVNPWA